MTITDEMVKDLVSGLRSIFGEDLLQIILYGSVARGEAGDESDVNIAMVLTGPVSQERKDAFIKFAARMDLKHDRVFSIIDIDRHLLEKWGETYPLFRNIRKEGIILWG